MQFGQVILLHCDVRISKWYDGTDSGRTPDSLMNTVCKECQKFRYWSAEPIRTFIAFGTVAQECIRCKISIRSGSTVRG
jgi:hypothetical protein